MMDRPYIDMTAPAATTHQTRRERRRGGVALGRIWPNSLLLQRMTRKNIIIIIISVVVMMYVRPCTAASKTEYFMDDYSACNLQGYIDIPTGVTITVRLKKPGGPTSGLVKCVLRFRAGHDKELLKAEYKEFHIGDCEISFYVNQQLYRCNAAKPYDTKLSTREVDIKLNRPLDAENYDGELLLSTYDSMDPGPRDDAVSNPALIGIIVGSVCGVILLILLLAVIGICCYQRNSYLRGSHTDPVLRNGESDVDNYYSNNMEKNGSPVGYTDIVKKFSDSKEEKDKDGLGVEVKGGEKSLIVDTLGMSPTKLSEFKLDKEGNGRGGTSGSGPRSPMVDALQSNPKFQASYQLTENEAEKRAQRLSNNNGGGDTPPTPPPPLPVISAPVPKMRTIDPNHAAIRRVPARSSATSDDLDLLERELLNGGGIQDDVDGDPGIKVLKPGVVRELATEVVPIKIQASKPKADVEIEDFDRTDFAKDDAPFSRSAYSSSSTVHSLRPNRHRSPASKSKQHQQAQPQQQQESTSRSKDAGLSSLRKRGPKSPRITTKGRRLVSEAEEGSVYADEQRADTPLSMMGVRSSRADDLESLPPLRRSASRQSLFASRSSLYSRRGKKERRPSVADSLDSYAQDDLTLYRSGSQANPMSKQNARAFKSLGSIIAPMAAETSTSDASCSTGRTRKKSAGAPSSSQHQHQSHARQMPKKSTSSHKSSMSTQTSDQKGTQTNSGTAMGTAMNQQQPVHPVALTKPLLKPTVKPLPPKNNGRGGGSGEHPSSQTAKLPPALLKSHFQPIAYNNNTNTTATDPGLPPPPPINTSKPAKSPWELLCELTDTDAHTSPPSESEVSTLGPRFEPTTRFTASPAPQLMPLSLTPKPYTATQTTTSTPEPLASNVPSTHSPFISTTVPLNPSASSAPARYTPSSLIGFEISSSSQPPMNVAPAHGTLPARKSSWDALKQLTDNQMSSAPQGNTESIV